MAKWKLRIARRSDIPTIYDLIRTVGLFEWMRNPEQVAIKGAVEILVCSIPCVSGKNCYEGERVIGFFIFGPYEVYAQPHFPTNVPKEGYAYGMWLVVDPELKGIGVEEALTLFAMAEAKAKTYRGMYTTALSTDKKLLKILNKLGFHTVTTFKDPSHPGLTIVLTAIDFS